MTTVPSLRRDGSMMDLASPDVFDIDFAEMASGLSKIARFNGRYSCAAYSVAQHSVFCADALYAENGDALLSAIGLLHDGHEYLIGDLTKPFADLIALNVEKAMLERGMLPAMAAEARVSVSRAIDGAKGTIDIAVFAKAGIGYPWLYPAHMRKVKDMDERMLRAEALALFGDKARPHMPAARRPAPKLTSPIEPWGPAKAEMTFLDRLERYLGIVVRPA